MYELDRLFDRDDVPGVSPIDVIDQGGKGGRFAGTSGTSDENEAASQVAELLHHGWNTEFFEGRDARGDEAEDGAVAVGLFEKVAAKARFLIHLVGKIEVTALFKNLPAFRATDFAQHRNRLCARDRLIANRHDVAMLPNLRRLAFTDMKIGRAFVYEDFEELIDVRHQKLKIRMSKSETNPKFEARNAYCLIWSFGF